MIRSSNEENEDKNANVKTDASLRSPRSDLKQGGQDPMSETAIEPDDDQREGQQSGSNKSKRNPFCSRCRNHGKSAQVKGHKRHCEYRQCQCYGCKLVEQRQLISAQQIRMRRNQKQDEEYGRRIDISPPVLSRPPGPRTTHTHLNQVSAATAAPSGTSMPSTTVSSSVDCLYSNASAPGSNEQLELVEEIYRVYGPLAIYAWLRLEQFNRQRIRELIEISRASYNDLRDSKSIPKHQPSRRGCPGPASDGSRPINCPDMESGDRNYQLQKQTPTLTQDDPHRSQQDNSAVLHAHVTTPISSHLQTPLNLNSTLSSSPIYTIGGSGNYLNHDTSNLFLTDKPAVSLASRPAHRHSLSSASFNQSLSSALAVQTQNILWPGLKLASSGIGPSSLIPPHLMPHFMQHHSFLAQQTQQHQLSLSSAMNGTGSSAASNPSALL